jgi:hypothetical protein
VSRDLPNDQELHVIDEPEELTQVAIRDTGTYTHALTKADYDRLMVGRTRHLRDEPIQRRRGTSTGAAITTTEMKDFT